MKNHLNVGKYPLLRPLIVWTIGILLECRYSISEYSAYILLLVALVMVASFFVTYKPRYELKATWGILFMSLVFFASVNRTCLVRSEGRSLLSAECLIAPLTSCSKSVREGLTARLSRLNVASHEKAVISTIALGDKSELSQSVRKKYSSIGIAHILAVSGFHVGIVAAFGLALSYFLSYSHRFSVIKYPMVIALVWGYASLTGLSAATVRAAIMITLYFVMKMLGRRTEPLNILIDAALLMLICDPLYLFDVGFQMSYLAVLSIVIVYPMLKAMVADVRNPLISYPMNCVLVSISAQVGVFALSAFYFHRFPIVFLLTAIPFAILTTLLVPLCLVWLCMPVESFVSQYLGHALRCVSHAMSAAVDYFNSFPIASIDINIGPYTCLAIYACLAAIAIYIHPYRPKQPF